MVLTFIAAVGIPALVAGTALLLVWAVFDVARQFWRNVDDDL
jgi:hypothetical protein